MIKFSHQGSFCCTPRGRRRRDCWSGPGRGIWLDMTMSGLWPRVSEGRAGEEWRPPSPSSPWGCSVSWSAVWFLQQSRSCEKSNWVTVTCSNYIKLRLMPRSWCHELSLELSFAVKHSRFIPVLTRFSCCWIFADQGIRPNCPALQCRNLHWDLRPIQKPSLRLLLCLYRFWNVYFMGKQERV